MLDENIITVKKNIELAGGHNVTIVAATKTISPEIISSLPDYGINIAGENRVQELLSKYDEVSGVSWHFIGRLQRNKVKYIVDKVDMIQSVDSIELAYEIEKYCAKISRVMPVLVEINMGEESKGGISICNAMELCRYVERLKWLRLKGIMSVLPKDAPAQMYVELHEFFDIVKNNFKQTDVLSVGMSGDYKMAVANGANMVRLGSCLFGQRVY